MALYRQIMEKPNTEEKKKEFYIELRPQHAGQPTKYTPETINKLEHAWMLGCSDSEACIYAGISRASLYTYLRENEPLKERRELLKNWHSLMARRNIGMALARPQDHGMSQSSIELSKWYLEKRNRDEFGPDKQPTNPGDTLGASFDAILKQSVEVKSSTLYIKKPENGDEPSAPESNDGGGVPVSEG